MWVFLEIFLELFCLLAAVDIGHIKQRCPSDFSIEFWISHQQLEKNGSASGVASEFDVVIIFVLLDEVLRSVNHLLISGRVHDGVGAEDTEHSEGLICDFPGGLTDVVPPLLPYVASSIQDAVTR